MLSSFLRWTTARPPCRGDLKGVREGVFRVLLTVVTCLPLSRVLASLSETARRTVRATSEAEAVEEAMSACPRNDNHLWDLDMYVCSAPCARLLLYVMCCMLCVCCFVVSVSVFSTAHGLLGSSSSVNLLDRTFAESHKPAGLELQYPNGLVDCCDRVSRSCPLAVSSSNLSCPVLQSTCMHPPSFLNSSLVSRSGRSSSSRPVRRPAPCCWLALPPLSRPPSQKTSPLCEWLGIVLTD